MELLERAGELNAVAALVAAAGTGRGGLLLVEAAAGLGKSTLLEHAAAMARAQGHLVLRARGHELETAFAWGVARTLFEGAALGGTDLLAGPAAPARLVFRTAEEPGDLPAADAGFAILHGLYWLAVRLAERAPLLIAVDDAQWADGPSLRWLTFLLGRLADLPIGVLVAARPGTRGEDGLLAQLAGDPDGTMCRLEPLGPDAVAELVRRRRPEADDGFCRRCFDLTGGNPLHLRELLVAIEAQPGGTDAEILAGGAALASRSLARSVRRRLAALSPAACRLARAVAVFENNAPLEMAAELAEVGTSAAPSAADELTHADLLRPGDPLEFIHPLVRSAVYHDLPPRGRAAQHRRAAALLVGDGAADECVAAHLLESPAAEDDEVVATLRATARRAFARGAPGSAVRYLDRALREPPSAAVRPELLAELGRAEGATGGQDAVAHLTEAVELAGDARTRAALLLELSRLLHDRGRLDEACEACLRGRAELAGDDELAAALDAAYLTSAMLSPKHVAEAHRRVREVLDRPTRLAGPADRALTSKAMIMQLAAGGNRDELLTIAKDLFAGGRLATEAGADSQALWHTMGALSYCDDYPTAEHAFQLASADARRRGSTIALAGVTVFRARQLLWTGPVAEAVDDARTAFDVWRGAGHMYVSAAGLCLVSALLEQDDTDQAETVLAAVEEHATPFGLFAAWRLAAAARVAARRGEDAEALRAFTRCGQHLVEIAQLNPVMLSWRSEAGLAALRLGQRDTAEELITEELTLAERFGAPRAIGVARRAAGLLARGEQSIELLRSASGLHHGCAAHLEHATTLVELGAAVRRTGRPAEARDPLREAITLAETLGAVHLAHRARTELNLAGGRAPARSHTPELTPGERRVARLAADGQTNRQIANALFITVKAVEWHLSNTYRKLRIRGRDEIAKALPTPGGTP
ncbi:AAA family ATPase [Amycolatopsis sp. NPDC021455]|uniref:AAA family ATPase n=1 Tax=Amycolatopsis sp. NPDC021455 TaxID=3154901 RepID=UPI003402CD68